MSAAISQAKDAPWPRRFAAGALIAAALLAYANSFGVPFLFDDGPSIVNNPSLRAPLRLADVLSPDLRDGETVSGRPLVNLSLALNHALSGKHVASYHAFNVVIHALAGLTLFGLMRRTLLQPVLQPRFGAAAQPLALSVALLWLLHPLQTNAVTYIIQRAESLMALFYLATLYAFVRAVGSPAPGRWRALSLGACLLGMATKEVMVSAPLAVLVYDRMFVAGTFRDAWRQRRGYYLGLATTWLPLALLVAGTEGRGGTAGFATVVTPWDYFLTQGRAIALYLRLAVWPSPLVFDYGTAVASGFAEVALPLLGLAALAALTGWGLWQRRAWAFAGFAFFAILAPSSSFVPIASQTIAEHRMYLALAAPLALAVLAAYRWFGRRALIFIATAAVALGFATYRRNADYRSELTLWADTVAKRPASARAHHNLGLARLEAGETESALRELERALQLKPGVADTHYNLGLAHARLGRHAPAREHYEKALALRPGHAATHNNLGNLALATSGPAAARAHYEQALKLQPAFAEAHSNLGNVLLQLGSAATALSHCEQALRLQPDLAEAHLNAGNACATLRRLAEARRHYERALALKDDATAHHHLANVLVELNDPTAALAHYTRAVELRPDWIDARRNLAMQLMNLGRYAAARPHLEILAQARPADAEIREALAVVRNGTGR